MILFLFLIHLHFSRLIYTYYFCFSSSTCITTGIWEKMLLPCLRSPSIFVQREGVTVIAAFILKLMDTQVRVIDITVIIESLNLMIIIFKSHRFIAVKIVLFVFCPPDILPFGQLLLSTYKNLDLLQGIIISSFKTSDMFLWDYNFTV